MIRSICRAICVLILVESCYGFRTNAKGSSCIFAKLGSSGTSSRLPSTAKRRLLQDNCSPLNLGNGPVSLTACSDLTSDLGTDLKFQWTVLDAGNGNSTLRGAIDAAYTEGSIDWAGVGFNQDLEMIGGNAFIVKADSSSASGASVDDYYLANTNSEGVQPPSQLSVSTQTAALVNGRLQAVFDLSLSIAADSLSTVGIIYAAGPVDSTGALEQHTYYSAKQLDMSTGVAQSLGPALAPATAESPASGNGPSPASSAAAAKAPASGLASAPSPSGGCTLEFAGNNSRLSFSQCQSLATAGTANNGFRLLWNLQASPTGNGSVMSAAIESGNPNYWAGYGIPSSPGVMQGAHAIIVKPCASCPTGASADKYALNGYSTSDVQPGTEELKVGELQAARSSAGSIQALFTLYLNQTSDQLNAPQNIIASVGPMGSGEQLQSHPVSYAYAGTVNLASGALFDTGTAGGGAEDRKTKVHALLMIIGWGLLLPLGTLFARCKEWGPIWFHFHRICQALAYLAGVAGAAVGVVLGRPNGTKLEQDHRIIGLTVFILLTVQVSAIVWRPAPRASKLRYTWNSLHWILGGSAIFLAFANVFIGLHISGQPAKWLGLYALGFGLIFILWAAKLAFNLVFARKRSTPEGKHAGFQGHMPTSNGMANSYRANGHRANGSPVPQSV